MAGLSGSGKSTTAAQLAQLGGAIRLRSDAVRKHLAGIPLDQTGGDDLYTVEMSTRTYQRLNALGVSLAAVGYRVILDAKFDRRQKRAAAIEAAADQGLELMFLHCTAPADVLRSRVEQRQGDIADATVEILARQSMESFGPEEPVTVVDTTQPREQVQRQLAQVWQVGSLC